MSAVSLMATPALPGSCMKVILEHTPSLSVVHVPALFRMTPCACTVDYNYF